MIYSTKEMNKKTVAQMYDYADEESLALLSAYTADFWADYRNNYAQFDRLFMKRFKTFQYFDQDGTEDIEDVTLDFIENVYMFLMANDKKYSELWRIHAISDTDLPIGRNYDITETMDRDTSRDVESVEGAREDSTEETLGSRADSRTITRGEQENVIDSDVYGFNSSTATPSGKSTETVGEREDTDDYTRGAQDNDSTFNKGEQTNTLEETGTEDFTRRRYGVVLTSPINLLEKHRDFWKTFSFYDMVFKDICAELLLVGREC